MLATRLISNEKGIGPTGNHTNPRDLERINRVHLVGDKVDGSTSSIAYHKAIALHATVSTRLPQDRRVAGWSKYRDEIGLVCGYKLLNGEESTSLGLCYKVYTPARGKHELVKCACNSEVKLIQRLIAPFLQGVLVRLLLKS